MKIMKCLLAAVLPLSAVSQNIGIGTTTPVPSAILELQANNKGVLIPRLTTLQINGISSPANGLLVYNTDSAAFTYRANSAWVYVKGTATPGNIAWSITGNDGTNAATHFIGTTNDMDLVFKRGGVRAGIINKDLLNTSWGMGALKPSTAGNFNTAIGVDALGDNSNGYENTATGAKALVRNTEGSQNTAYGSGSLIYNTTGNRNTALSTYALFNNTDGYENTATGYAALYANQTGTGNTAIGSLALSQTKGTNNTAVGFSAGADNVSGSFNLFLGNEAGRSETGSNKLYISNSNTNKSNTLIYGEFDNKLLAIGGKMGIGRQPAFYPLEIQGLGTSNDLLQFTNSAGVGKWHLNLKENGSLNFSESGVADHRMVLGAGGNIGIGLVPDSSFPLQIKGKSAKSNIMLLFNEAGVAKWNVNLEGDNLNFSRPGNPFRQLLLGGNGEVRIGQNSSNQGRLTVKQRGDDDGISIEHPTNGNHWTLYHSTSGNGLVLDFNGFSRGVFATADGSYSNFSDRRLKKDITAYQPVLDKLMQIKPYNYHYIQGDSHAPFSSGFMAQDIQKIFPDAVSALEYKNGEVMLGINYQYFTVAAIKGIQEQQQKINEQEQKINEQELRIQKLEAALQKFLPGKE